MKAKLEFNLPEEREDLEDALNAWKFRATLSEFDGWLRNKEKYTDEKPESYQAVRDELLRVIQENGLEI